MHIGNMCILTGRCLCFLLLHFLQYIHLRSQLFALWRSRRVCQLLPFDLVDLLWVVRIVVGSRVCYLIYVTLQRHRGVVLGHMLLLLRCINSALDLSAEPGCFCFLLCSGVLFRDMIYVRSVRTRQPRCFRVVSVVVDDIAMETCATRWKLPLAPYWWLWCDELLVLGCFLLEQLNNVRS